MGALSGIASLRDRRPEHLRPLDLAVLSAATFKAARTVAHDEVLSFLREPFVQGAAHEGGEKPVEDGGTRQAIGELLTCSRCIGMWAAAGVVGVHTVAPLSGGEVRAQPLEQSSGAHGELRRCATELAEVRAHGAVVADAGDAPAVGKERDAPDSWP